MRWLPVLLLISVAACGGGTPARNAIMSDWLGHHRDKLISVWGPPSQEQAFIHGGKSIVYIEQESNLYGGPHRTCRRLFNTNFRGEITSVAADNCPLL